MMPPMEIRTIQWSTLKSFSSQTHLWLVVYRSLCRLKNTQSVQLATTQTNNVFLLRFHLSAYFPFPPYHLQLSLENHVYAALKSVWRAHILFLQIPVDVWNMEYAWYLCVCVVHLAPGLPFREELEGKSTSTHFTQLFYINYGVLCFWLGAFSTLIY